MPIPSPVKITKTGVEFISQVDRAKYLLAELVRAALRDVGKLVVKRIRAAARRLPGMRRSKRPYTAFQYWNRKKSVDLQIGVKHGTWYGEQQELGTQNQPKRALIRDITFGLIPEIRQIEGAYIKEIEDENRALGLIDEEEEVGPDDQAQ